MIAIGYGRVSTSKQVEFGTSLKEQERLCRLMAEQDGISDFIWIADEGISGGTSEREGYKKFLAFIRSGNCKVYAYSMSRLARNIRTMMDFWDLCDKHKVEIRTYSDNVNTAGAMGKFIRIILAAVWELQREMIGEDTKDKLRSRKAQGIVYSPPRYGYSVVGRVIDEYGRVVTPGNEVPDEFEQGIISEIKKAARNGVGASSIAASLNNSNIPTKNNKRWHRNTVLRIINNEAP